MILKYVFRVINILLAILVLPSFCNAATYYVDAMNGKDTNSGLSIATSWKTIAKVNSSRFNPGDQILFKRGQIWREKLVVVSNGADGSPVVLSAYETGNPPIICGSEVVSEWVAVESSFRATVNSEVLSVFFNSINLTQSKGSQQRVPVNTWDWNSGSLFINVGQNPEKGIIEVITVASQDDGIDIKNTSYVSIINLNIKHVKRWSINGINSTHLTTKNCLIEYSGPGDAINYPVGIALNQNTAYAIIENNTLHDIKNSDGTIGGAVYIGSVYDGKTYNAHDNLIKNNVMYNCKTGIVSKYGSVNNIIEGNVIYGMSNRGIAVTGSESGGNVVRNNKVYQILDLNGAAIETFNNTTIAYNVLYDNYNALTVICRAVETENYMNSGDNNRIFNNTFSGNTVHIGFANSATSQGEGNIVKNNIFFNGTRGISYAYDPGVTINGMFDFNVYYRSVSTLYFYAGGSLTLEGWKAKCSAETHSIWVNPGFVDWTNHNFQLLPDSACIDAGSNLGLTKDNEGKLVPQGNGVDIGALEYDGGNKSLRPPSNLKVLDN